MVPNRILSLLIIVTVTFSGLRSATGQSQEPGLHATGLFGSDEVLQLRLSGDIRQLMRDRSDDMQYHGVRLSYQANDSSLVSIPIKVKTRGHFRRTEGHCAFPPLQLNFSKKNTKKSLFADQNKLKLVTPCADEKYVVREYLVYKLYNLITPRSFRARLVKVLMEDTVRRKPPEEIFGILLEDEMQMARRNNSLILEDRALKPEQTQVNDFLSMAVFQYMIGNTDWSIQYFQNIKLIVADRHSLPSPVPYDFDHAGIVSAPYAKPEDALRLSSVRERRYRGYCTPLPSFEETISMFNERKEEIYRVYTQCPWLEESYVKTTVKYLDEFYATINDPKLLASEFGYPCQKDGTGNVVIKGLKKK